jgi:hypothetical protein
VVTPGHEAGSGEERVAAVVSDAGDVGAQRGRCQGLNTRRTLGEGLGLGLLHDLAGAHGQVMLAVHSSHVGVAQIAELAEQLRIT